MEWFIGLVNTDGFTNWTVVGEQSLTKNMTLNGGDTLTVPLGSTLNLGSGVIITHSGQSINIQGTMSGTESGNNEIVINNAYGKREVLHNNNVTNVALKFPVEYALDSFTKQDGQPTEIDVFGGNSTAITVSPVTNYKLNALEVRKTTGSQNWAEVYTKEGDTVTIDNSKVTEPITVYASSQFALAIEVTDEDGIPLGEDYFVARLYKNQADNFPTFTFKVKNNNTYPVSINRFYTGSNAYFDELKATGVSDPNVSIAPGESAEFTLKLREYNFTTSPGYLNTWPVGHTETGPLVLRMSYTSDESSSIKTLDITFAEGKIIIIDDISDATMKLSKASTTYNGSDQTPTITVTKGGNTLTAGTDYDVVWKDADGKSVAQLKNAGAYTPTVIGKGIYDGEVVSTTSFTIAKAPAPAPSTVTVSRNYAATKVSVPTGIVAGEVSDVSVDADGKVSNPALDGTGNLTFALSGGANGETIELPVSIQSPNYEGTITATVAVTLTDKLDQRPFTVKATSTTVPSGGRLELSVSGSTLTGEASGTVTVIVTKAGTGQYNPARSEPLVITIE